MLEVELDRAHYGEFQLDRSCRWPDGSIEAGIQAALVSGQVAAGVPGRDLALADGDHASGIVAEFPLAAAGLITAGVIPPLPIDL